MVSALFMSHPALGVARVVVARAVAVEVAVVVVMKCGPCG